MIADICALLDWIFVNPVLLCAFLFLGILAAMMWSALKMLFRS